MHHLQLSFPCSLYIKYICILINYLVFSHKSQKTSPSKRHNNFPNWKDTLFTNMSLKETYIVLSSLTLPYSNKQTSKIFTCSDGSTANEVGRDGARIDNQHCRLERGRISPSKHP